MFSDVSHPSWVRGLKQKLSLSLHQKNKVAPLVGAWIETNVYSNFANENKVAPLVGAWIETEQMQGD